MGSALCINNHNKVTKTWPEHTRVTTYAVIIENPKPSARAVSTTVCLKGGMSDGRLVRISLPTSHDTRPLSLTAGQVLLISTTIRPPYNFVADPTFDYATYLRRHGISGQAFCPAHSWQLLPESEADTLRSTLPLFTRLRLVALSLRDRLIDQYVDHVAGSGRSVITALTLGDTSEIDRPTRDAYSQTGASHVLSLSGLHLSILFGVAKLLVLDRCSRRTTRTASHLLAIAGLWAFALLAGLPVSLVRSTTMYSILCLADMSQRPNASFNSLATAAFFILLCAPMALFDVSFQLSFLSVAAILLILPLLTPEPGTWLTRLLTSFVTLPVVAQIVVAPLVAYYFQTVPLYFLMANLVAIPASTPYSYWPFLFSSFRPTCTGLYRTRHGMDCRSHERGNGRHRVMALCLFDVQTVDGRSSHGLCHHCCSHAMVGPPATRQRLPVHRLYHLGRMHRTRHAQSSHYKIIKK